MPDREATGVGEGSALGPARSAGKAAPSGLRAFSAAEFLLRFARAGHNAGYPTADLEVRVRELASSLGVAGVQMSATPTIIELSIGPLEDQRSFTLRVRPKAVDLDGIARLDDLAQKVLDGDLETGSAITDLSDIVDRPLRRPVPVMLAAYSLAGGALTPLLGGGLHEALAGAAVGLLAGSVALLAARAARTEQIVSPVAAAAASFGAALLVWLGWRSSPDIVTLAAIVTFLPGMTLTIGMRELATEHLQSGVANTANALVQLLGIVFGVGIGNSIATAWFGTVVSPVSHTAFSVPYVAAAVGAGLAFTVTLRAQLRAAPMMCAACLLALVANAAGESVLGAEAGVFIAAVSVGVAGGVIGSIFRHSPLVFIVPGILMLVPGSAGFQSILQLLTGQTVNGVEAGVKTFVTALSIAYGLMVSAMVLPRRFTRAGGS